jgi:hypothetical protein
MAKKKNEEFEGEDVDMDYEDEPDFSQDPPGFVDNISDEGKKKHTRHFLNRTIFGESSRFEAGK